MTTTQFCPLIKQQFLDDNGAPLSNGLVYTYLAGTNTLALSYEDRAGNNPNTNPVVLDAAGRADIYLDMTLRYKITVADENDVPLYTVDKVYLDSGDIEYDSTVTYPSGSTGVAIKTAQNDIDAIEAQLAAQDAYDIPFTQVGTGVVSNVGVKLNEVLSVKDFGAVGDGSTDDTAAIQACLTYCGSTGTEPYTAYFPHGTYKVTSSLTVTCHTFAEHGAIITPVSIAASAKVFNVTVRTKHTNVRIQGNASVDPANGTIGFYVSPLIASSRSTFISCSVVNCAYGFLITSFSQMLFDCRANNNTVNLSMYATSSSVQINDNHIIGGNYSGPIGNYAIKIGDSSFSTTISPGQPHGSNISVKQTALDGGTLKLESVIAVELDNLYFEGSASGICIELANDNSQDGYVDNVKIGPCFFNIATYAIFCNAGVNNLVVEPSTYTSISKCALYIYTDIYPVAYSSGYAVSSFTLAPEVHTGRRQATYTAHNFSYLTQALQGIFNGKQTVISEPLYQLAQCTWFDVFSIKQNSPTNYGYGRRYKTPVTGKAGTLNSYVLTMTTASDAGYFNGGDEYAGTGAVGGGVINRVDYEAGTMTLSDSSVGTPTAGTISQTTSAWSAQTVTTTNAAPTTGTWARGDICNNGTPTVGQPKGWICTVAGTPGTWVSTGNL